MVNITGLPSRHSSTILVCEVIFTVMRSGDSKNILRLVYNILLSTLYLIKYWVHKIPYFSLDAAHKMHNLMKTDT